MRTVDCSTPVEKDIPQSLEISIGGYTGSSYSVKLERGCHVYQPYTHGYQPLEALEISPSADEWKAFRQQLVQLDVWSWESDYEDPGATDGTNWTVDLKYPDKGISSGGSNNFPSEEAYNEDDDTYNEDEDEDTYFDEFLRAVSRLLGSLTFQ